MRKIKLSINFSFREEIFTKTSLFYRTANYARKGGGRAEDGEVIIDRKNGLSCCQTITMTSADSIYYLYFYL